MKPKLRKVTVIINKGQGAKETIEGIIVRETTTFFHVIHETNKDIGESFPKSSERINCHEQDHASKT